MRSSGSTVLAVLKGGWFMLLSHNFPIFATMLCIVFCA